MVEYKIPKPCAICGRPIPTSDLGNLCSLECMLEAHWIWPAQNQTQKILRKYQVN